jgi:Membrane carboxypeptidase/penicillin-binding protein PbpC
MPNSPDEACRSRVTKNTFSALIAPVPHWTDHRDRQQRHQEPVAREEPQARRELRVQAGTHRFSRSRRARSWRQPQQADGQVGHDIGGGVDGQRPLEADGEQQERRDGRPDDSGRRHGGLGESGRSYPVLFAVHDIPGRSEPGGVEELADPVQHEYDEVDGGEPEPDGEVADRDERQPRQARDHRRADRLGPHHRQLPVPPVHEHPGDRPDQANRGARGDQDPADRGGSPGRAAHENLRTHSTSVVPKTVSPTADTAWPYHSFA